MAVEELLGPIPPGWEYTTLAAACDRGNGSIQTGPFGSQLHASDYVTTGIPSIMPQNIGDNRIIEDGIARITPADAQRLSRYLVREHDIVYSRRGDVERRALVRSHEDGWLCGTGCLRVRLGTNGVDPRYASFYLGHPNVREWIVRHAHGATMPNLNTAILSGCPFVIPPTREQLAIAEVLSAFEEKIELNRRMNRTMEDLAQAIFTAWFINFEPVKAKTAGALSFRGMTQDIFDRLPTRFTNAGSGAVPEGWEHVPIGDLVDIVGGSTPSTKSPEYWQGGAHPFCTPKDMSRLTSPVLLNTERNLTLAGINTISSGQLPVGTVVLSSRAPIGYLAVAEIPVSVNQGIIAMRTGNIPSSYVLLWARANMEAIESRAGGSTFAEISKRNFRTIPAVRPDEPTLKAFGNIAKPFFDAITINERASRVLVDIRDALLPVLLSGRLRAPYDA